MKIPNSNQPINLEELKRAIESLRSDSYWVAQLHLVCDAASEYLREHSEKKEPKKWTAEELWNITFSEVKWPEDICITDFQRLADAINNTLV